MRPLFRTEEGRRVYEAAYRAVLGRWPIPTESHWIETKLGRTHVLVAGDESRPPLVLLPAVSVSATEWFANVGELAREFRLFAVDVVGDAGLSTLSADARCPADYADWLAECFAKLGLERPAVAGHSYGGWLTLQLASWRPDAVGPAAVLSPSAGLAPFHWYMRLFLSMAERLPWTPDARKTLLMQAYRGFEPDPDFVRLMEATVRHARTNVLFPGVLSDEELSRIGSPLLVLIGTDEVLYDPRAALERALRRVPQAEGALIPDCGHLILMEKPDEVNRRVRAFLARCGYHALTPPAPS